VFTGIDYSDSFGYGHLLQLTQASFQSGNSGTIPENFFNQVNCLFIVLIRKRIFNNGGFDKSTNTNGVKKREIKQ